MSTPCSKQVEDQAIPLTNKEVYRLKASWNAGLETNYNIREAGVHTILGYVYFYSYYSIWSTLF